ncbi:hypothetical protein HDA41_000960 [Streptomyces caelestis]|uniref:Uncharacterized protein n=1 Tax=Streptomyces caelestis TaxID=36816 RepID=A0A7W9H0E5_9ACTN|nr:hypothetical protein [Streptomyces caelestis]
MALTTKRNREVTVRELCARWATAARSPKGEGGSVPAGQRALHDRVELVGEVRARVRGV